MSGRLVDCPSTKDVEIDGQWVTVRCRGKVFDDEPDIRIHPMGRHAFVVEWVDDSDAVRHAERIHRLTIAQPPGSCYDSLHTG